MKLDKAKEILTAEKEVATRTGRRELHDALQVGIEAIERVEYQHTPGGVTTEIMLPSETEE